LTQNQTMLSDHTHTSQNHKNYRSFIRHYIKKWKTQTLKHAVSEK